MDMIIDILELNCFFGNGRVDYQFQPKTYSIDMTTYNTLSIHASIGGFDTNDLSSFDEPYFLYRNSIDRITFCADQFLLGTSHIKVYTIFEDLL